MAAELAQQNWAAIAKNPKFIELSRRKNAFLFGWWIFSTVYYFMLPILAGAEWAQPVFRKMVIGHINIAYLFALSQFFVSWALAIYYASWANRVSDKMTTELLQELRAK